MTSRRSPRSTRLSRAFRRLGLVLPAAILVVVSLLDFRAWERAQRRLAELAEETGAAQSDPEILRRMRRELDPIHAGLELATALLAEELDAGSENEPQPRVTGTVGGRGIERLLLARGLAETAMSRRPAAWRAALVVGGATYLERFRTRDPRLFADSGAWERPLLLARRLGTAYPEPLRFLAAAYLGNWAGLTPEKRREATGLIEQAFEDEETLTRLLQTWLRVAPSLQLALSVLPDTSWAWNKMQAMFARQQDWERYCLARGRWVESLVGDLEERLGQADLLSRLGDSGQARGLYLEIIRNSRPDLQNTPIVRQALERLPPGPIRPSDQAHFEAWLIWSLDICLFSECPLPPHAIERLAGLTGFLDSEVQALAALAARGLARAEMIERRAANLIHEAWGPYFILKARRQLEMGDSDDAATSLTRVPLAWRKSPAFWLARKELAVASRIDDEEVSVRLEELSRSYWPRFLWRWRNDVARLEVLTSGPAEAIRLRIAEAPRGGGAVELRWDGSSLGAFAIAQGRALTLTAPVTGGLHLLELVPLEGARVIPGELELIVADREANGPRPRPPGESQA